MTPARWGEGNYVKCRFALAEDDYGDILIPALWQSVKRGEAWWGRRFDARKPWHWPYYFVSCLVGGVNFVESA